jgi:GTP cyclohydrolase I
MSHQEHLHGRMQRAAAFASPAVRTDAGLPEARIANHFRAILRELGEDVDREGLRDTPKRYAKALLDLTTRVPFTCTTFKNEGTDEMIVQTGIAFSSVCEHHVLPFYGTAAVAYIPGEEIVGLSKLARAVRYFAAGLQNQERITSQVVAFLEAQLKPRGVAVKLVARHSCMELRGVRAHGAETTTSCLTGAFKYDDKARSEFLSLAAGR